MSTSTMTGWTAETSPRLRARIAGIFYLLTFVMGISALVVSGNLVVSGDAVATAANIMAHTSSFRLGVALELLATACYVAVTALFYELFKPVNRSVSLLAACFSLVGCAVGAVSASLNLAPLVVLGGAPYLSGFTVEQLRALALVLLKLSAQANNTGLIFFGFYCLLIGYLVFKSTFLPRVLGVLMALGGLGWLTFLAPPLASYLSGYVLAPGILGEGALTLWLLARGVDARRWNERDGGSRKKAGARLMEAGAS